MLALFAATVRRGDVRLKTALKVHRLHTTSLHIGTHMLAQPAA